MEHPKPESEPNGETKVREPEQKSDPKDSGRLANGDANAGSVVKGSGSEPEPETKSLSQLNQSIERLASPGSIKKSVHWSPELVTESTFVSSPQGDEPRYSFSPASSSSFSVRDSVVNVRSVLERWGKRVAETTRKAENLAGNTWQHLKTSPSFTEAALGRIAQGTKVLAEGGYERIFLHTFETVPDEQLLNSYACYLSTSAGPVMGILYLSTAKLAYCSDNPLSYKSNDQTEWSYYKVVIPLHQLKAVNPSSSRGNPSEKYIQVISVENHEFWFMGFLNYDGAVSSLKEALEANRLEPEE
ncbi:hypothetical protein L6164_020532 [Bauhinia variegata]|uniref:Uncharacterized protein n=1 Tax=Bauhinia variegata TaxID=167791 RepID=A0ACB9MWT6_BAUVA|nr:hypothetical protein L6164_020532 [Bauhinia variegata]